jgi:phosphomannomutase
MARTRAVVGGEHSGHYYFRDFWYADSGLLAALHVLAALAESPEPLSATLAPYSRYVASGEVNTPAGDPAAVLAALRARYADDPSVTVDELDGVTVSHHRWWLNLRASNTEPLLRLNVEGVDAPTMVSVRDRTASMIRGHAGDSGDTDHTDNRRSAT